MADDRLDEVVTPGGMRPQSMVHRVDPGQAVSGTSPVVTDAGEPEGMRPPSTADAIASTHVRRGAGKKQAKRSSTDVADVDVESRMQPTEVAMDAALEAIIQPPGDVGVTIEYPEEPPGMRPVSTEESVERVTGVPTLAPERPAAVATTLVATPGGYRDPSRVHHIEPGHVLRMENGNLRKMHVSGHEVADFGALRLRPIGQPLMPANVFRDPARVPALGSGWISYASWTNNTGRPVSRFSTTWVVPPPPATDHGQTIFLFNGIQNSTMIYQPVLQWGRSGAGGGSYWAVASWYVDGQGGVAFHSNLVRVNPGDVLTGVIHSTGQSGGLFSYGCEFTGIANTSLPINNVQELTWNIETLEAYGIQQCSDYPNTNFTAFTGIDLQTTAGHPALGWSATNAVTDCGQSARVVSNANAGGEVDIYYRTRVAVSSATASRNSDGRLETFEVATNGGVWNVWQTAPHAGPWSPINSLGGIVKAPVCQALNSDGRLEIFGIGTDNAAYDNWQTAPHAGPWSGWNRLGGWVSQIAVARNSDGRLELFGIGGDGAVYNTWQTAPHSGPWSGWNRLGGVVKQISVSLNSDGRLELFAIGSDNALYNIWQTVPHGGPWSGWNRLGGWVSQIASTINSDGRLEVFGIGADGALYDIWQTVPHGGPWSAWNRLGGWVKQIVPMCNSDGRLEVFGIGSDGALHSIWQTVPHAGPWSAWTRLGGWVSQISAALNSDGRLEVFGVGADNSLYNIWQTVPHAGPWSGWNRLT